MSSFSIKNKDITSLIEISRKAGNAIMEIYKGEIEISSKSDLSPLTEADLISHKIILESLRKINPNIPIISEESPHISFIDRAKWDRYWLVDPLDGTKEFINGNGDFTTNIALIIKNKPVFGIIHAPAINQTYWGGEVSGSYFLDGDSDSDIKKIEVSKKSRDKIRIVTSRSHPSKKLESFLKDLSEYEVVKIGSSLKFCLIAKGDADFYPRFGPTSEWDTAAGHAIVKYAGGNVKTLDGNEIKYNKKSHYINPKFIVFHDNKFADMVFRKSFLD